MGLMAGFLTALFSYSREFGSLPNLFRLADRFTGISGIGGMLRK